MFQNPHNLIYYVPMENNPAEEWARETAARIGRAVKAHRMKAGITAAQLADRTEELGFPLNRVAITKIENGHRRGKFDVTELIVLATALQVPPVLLVYPDIPDGPVHITPTFHPDTTHPAYSEAAAQWFGGSQSLILSWVTWYPDIQAQVETAESNRRPMELVIRREAITDRRSELRDTLLRIYDNNEDATPPDGLLKALTDIDREIKEIEDQMRNLGMPVRSALDR